MTTTLNSRMLPFAVIVFSFAFFWALVAFALTNAEITDPAEILTRGVQTTADATTVHVTLTVSGSVTEPDSGMTIPLNGSSVEGDVDLADRAAHLTFAVPSLLGLNGELIVVGTDTYVLTSMSGDKWLHMASGEGGEPMSEPPTDEEIADAVADLLATEGVELEKLADAPCGDDTCYQLRLTVPAEAMAEHGSTGGPGDLGGMVPHDPFTGPVVLNLAFEKGGLWLRELSTSAEGEDADAFAVTASFSDYNAAVDVGAPPADQVTEDGDFPLFPN